MITFELLGAAIRDPEIRKKFGKVAARMVTAELKAARAVAAVSARLSDPKAEEDNFLKNIVERHLDFYEGLVERSVTFHQEVIDSLREADAAKPADQGAAERDAAFVDLSASTGSIARTPFRIANNRPATVTITCRATPFVSDDGQVIIGDAVAFDPPAAQIEAGKSVDFDAVISVNANFKPGKTYTATIYVDGADAMRIALQLAVVAPPADASKSDPAGPASKSAGAVATANTRAKATRVAAPSPASKPSSRKSTKTKGTAKPTPAAKSKLDAADATRTRKPVRRTTTSKRSSTPKKSTR